MNLQIGYSKKHIGEYVYSDEESLPMLECLYGVYVESYGRGIVLSSWVKKWIWE